MRTSLHFLCASLLLCSGIALAQTPGPEKKNTDSTTSAVLGDIHQGQTLIEGKGGCLQCHRLFAKGSRLGPNLNEVAADRTPLQLELAILAPDPKANPQYRLYKIVTRDGKEVTGKLLNQDMYSLQLLDMNENLVAFKRSDIHESGFVDAPPMPSFKGILTDQEITDIVAYLASLKSGSSSTVTPTTGGHP